jgi:hypothetical protein
MNYKNLGELIITNVGGEENIQGITHCATGPINFLEQVIKVID